MTFTLEICWWIAPAMITVFLFIAATISAFRTSGERHSGLLALFLFFIATMFAVIAWLTWGVLT